MDIVTDHKSEETVINFKISRASVYILFGLLRSVLMLKQTLAYFADSTHQISMIFEVRDESTEVKKKKYSLLTKKEKYFLIKIFIIILF